MDVDFLVDRFIRSLGSDASTNTQRMYRRVTRQFLEFLASEGVTPADAGMKTIEDFFFDMDKPLSSNSERAYLSVLSSFYDHLMVQDEAGANPAAQYRKAAKKRFHRRQEPTLNVMTPEMFAKVLDAVRTLGKSSHKSQIEIERNVTVLHVLFGSGLRRAEVHALNCNAYDCDSGALVVQRGKGGKMRRVALLAESEEVLCGYLAEIRPAFSPPPDEPAMFLERRNGQTQRFGYEAIGYLARQALRASGVFIAGDMGTHVFRRSHGTLIQRQTGNPKLVQQQLGHASITTTERYVKLADDEHIDQIRDRVGLSKPNFKE